MTFAEQLTNLFNVIREHTSVEPYVARKLPGEYQAMLDYMMEIGKSKPINCCMYHRRGALMNVWCGGLSFGIQLYQMFGEASDLRELLEEREMPGGEEHHHGA